MFEPERGRGPRAERGRASVEKLTYPQPSYKPTQKKGNLKTHLP